MNECSKERGNLYYRWYIRFARWWEGWINWRSDLYLATPSRTHQRLSGFLSRKIGNYIESKNGECEVYAAPFAVFLNSDDSNYVEPDISVVCDPSKLDEKGCHGAPDWIIEIVSPTSRQMDYYKKLFKYRTAGVREYWIIDPAKELIMEYRFESETMEQYSFGEDISVGIYDDFSIRISWRYQ